VGPRPTLVSRCRASDRRRRRGAHLAGRRSLPERHVREVIDEPIAAAVVEIIVAVSQFAQTVQVVRQPEVGVWTRARPMVRARTGSCSSTTLCSGQTDEKPSAPRPTGRRLAARCGVNLQMMSVLNVSGVFSSIWHCIRPKGQIDEKGCGAPLSFPLRRWQHYLHALGFPS
jgi:hypothetical protein